ncbi:hypothetical protein KTD31_03680 [Burkholderia multivorans]|jgi:hypothetical protein|uniref:hypothetical protein n=1 Tax=Burkholderia multivorans TaxID=87883 RepID=UPI001C240B76|nr:hypothetical protein [Burkholderia multivorans]MBU9200455.1 hypothetical protein [Burkholderia multivorans]
MAFLKLNDFGTRKVLSQFDLTAARRIGKGQFCAVYEDGPDAVFKLTTDAIQLESVRDYLGGVHFPKMLDNIGYVGEQHMNELSLFLFKSERLKPLREGDAATRKLGRQVIRIVGQCLSNRVTQSKVPVRGSFKAKQAHRTLAALEQLTDNKALPETMREAFEDIQRMVRDYDGLVIDFHGANLMVRGTDEIVFNDIIVDGSLLYRNVH